MPLLLGYNVSEGEYFESPTTRAAYEEGVRREYGAYADRFLRQYPASGDAEAGRAKANLWAESAFGWQMYAWAEINSRTSAARTFFYRFSSKFGNGHGAELPYVFNYPFGGPWNAEQQEMGRIVSRYWSRFAASGDPNDAGLPSWPAYDTKNKRVMSLGEETGTRTMPDLEAHLLMNEYKDSKRGGSRQRDEVHDGQVHSRRQNSGNPAHGIANSAFP